MIEKINSYSVNSQNGNVRKQPNFKGGLLDVAMLPLLACEQNPMLNVTVLDLSTAIIPRTIVEGQTNPYSGFEAFRRESSGLIVNCLLPGVIVAGVAKAAAKPILGTFSRVKNSITGEKSLMSRCWANEETINTIKDLYKNAKGSTTEEKIGDTLHKMFDTMQGLDGDIANGGLKNFKDFKLGDIADKLKTEICAEKFSEGNIKAIYYDPKNESCLSTRTHSTQTIKLPNLAPNAKAGDMKSLDTGLDALVKEGSKILREFHVQGITKNEAVDEFAKKAVSLVKAKSWGGLAVIIPLALSVQPLNRWWTSKVAGKKGAPIYNDFTNSQTKELTPEQKSDLRKQKAISIGTMIGAATLSILAKGGNPLAVFKNIGQFSNIFPTMDQARVVSTATFASRMGSSEDKNELRESTMRDIATFFSFYFIGDYVAKASASAIEKLSKGKIKLINNKEARKADAGILQNMKHWFLKTSLKATEEVLPESRKWRALCQLNNILFSLVLLGLVIPKVYRHHTEKAHEAELKEQGIDSNKNNTKPKEPTVETK